MIPTDPDVDPRWSDLVLYSVILLSAVGFFWLLNWAQR